MSAVNFRPLHPTENYGRISEQWTTDEDRWAETYAISRAHGADAARWVGEQTVAMRLAGDEDGVRRFREIAARLEQLTR